MKLSRRERKNRAEVKRGAIVRELLDYMQAEMARTKDWERVCALVDHKIAAMIRLHPQEASIIREAVHRLTDELERLTDELETILSAETAETFEEQLRPK